MVTREDIEGFLDRLTTDDSQTTYEEIGDGIWRVRPGGALASRPGRAAIACPLIPARAETLSALSP